MTPIELVDIIARYCDVNEALKLRHIFRSKWIGSSIANSKIFEMALNKGQFVVAFELINNHPFTFKLPDIDVLCRIVEDDRLCSHILRDHRFQQTITKLKDNKMYESFLTHACSKGLIKKVEEYVCLVDDSVTFYNLMHISIKNLDFDILKVLIDYTHKKAPYSFIVDLNNLQSLIFVIKNDRSDILNLIFEHEIHLTYSSCHVLFCAALEHKAIRCISLFFDYKIHGFYVIEYFMSACHTKDIHIIELFLKSSKFQLLQNSYKNLYFTLICEIGDLSIYQLWLKYFPEFTKAREAFLSCCRSNNKDITLLQHLQGTFDIKVTNQHIETSCSYGNKYAFIYLFHRWTVNRNTTEMLKLLKTSIRGGIEEIQELILNDDLDIFRYKDIQLDIILYCTRNTNKFDDMKSLIIKELIKRDTIEHFFHIFCKKKSYSCIDIILHRNRMSREDFVKGMQVAKKYDSKLYDKLLIKQYDLSF